MGHILRRHVEYLGRRGGVDILPRGKGRLHGRISGNVGQKPQLNLGIIGVNKHTALRGTNSFRISRPSSIRTGMSAGSALYC